MMMQHVMYGLFCSVFVYLACSIVWKDSQRSTGVLVTRYDRLAETGQKNFVLL